MSLLAGLRERRQLGDLAIELESSRARVQILESMAAGMLGCVQSLVLDIEEIGAPALQAELGTLLVRLQAGGAPDALVDDAARCRLSTLEFAEQERKHLATRDAELRRIIQVLTEGLAAVSVGAASYHRTLLESGTRFEAASRLSDLVRMRATITDEVQALRTTVAHRQAAESTVSAALRAEIDLLRATVETAKVAARIDPMTRASNRAAFDDELLRRCEAAATGGPGFALMLADVDHFKQINDTHGHLVGDRVLQALVTFLRDRVRRDDMIARWGGEEFCVILPGASLRPSLAKARTLVAELARTGWAIDEAREVTFTISVGVTTWKKGDAPGTLVERVDRAMYAAKRGGRNRAVKG